MFSALKKQKKAEELVEEARQIIEEADKKSSLAKEKLENIVAQADEIHNNLAQKTLKSFQELFFRIKGVEPIETADITQRPYTSQLQVISERLAEIEPVEINDVKRGKFPAILASLAAMIITVIAGFAIAFVATGTPLNLQSATSTETLMKLLTWIGGGAFGYPEASVQLGIIGLGIAAIIAAFIVWSICMSKSSGKNLQAAQQSHTDAKNYHDRKEFFATAMQNMNEEISQFNKILETFDIFLQEYNATINRILFTEDDEFENFKNDSKLIIERAAATAEAVIPLLNIAITASDGTPSKQLSVAIAKGELYKRALIEQKPLPDTTVEEEDKSEIPIETSKDENGKKEPTKMGESGSNL